MMYTGTGADIPGRVLVYQHWCQYTSTDASMPALVLGTGAGIPAPSPALSPSLFQAGHTTNPPPSLSQAGPYY